LDEQLKQRLVGAAVIVSLIVIFVPMLLDEPDDSEPVEMDTRIPDKPQALQDPLPSREILPKPVPAQPTPGVAEPEPVQPPEDWSAEEAPSVPDQKASENTPSVVETPSSGESGRSTPAAWVVQVASFTHRENATRLVERLKQADMPAQLQEVKIGGKQHYRVQMLPQLDRKDAEKLINRIDKAFKLKATLLHYSD